MATNGNEWTKWIARWAIAALWSVLVAAIIFMGNVVKANDLKREDGDKRVEEHSQVRDVKQQEEIEDVKEIVTEIRLEQRTIMVTLMNIEKKLP